MNHRVELDSFSHNCKSHCFKTANPEIASADISVRHCSAMYFRFVNDVIFFA